MTDDVNKTHAEILLRIKENHEAMERSLEEASEKLRKNREKEEDDS